MPQTSVEGKTSEGLLARLAQMPAAQRQEILDSIDPEDLTVLAYDWMREMARPAQVPPPGDWRFWVILAGRGFGKTRTGAEWVRHMVETHQARRVAIVAATAADARDVMVEGESGLLAVSPPWARPTYEPSKRRLTWPNGALGTVYSADEPDRLRGPQHDAAWCDELAAWRYPDAWDMLLMGLRLGKNPRAVVTTTPRPTREIRELVEDDTAVVTRGSTFDNKANLAPAFIDAIVRRYEGTRLGRQELHAEILDDVPGALWTRDLIETARVKTAPDLERVVIGVDPAVTSGENSDETGIVVAGIDEHGEGYVLEDVSGRYTPQRWAEVVQEAYRRHQADRVVAEVNNGGDLVEHVLRSAGAQVSYSAVSASRGKAKRAEPIAALYEQGRVHHVGMLAALEDQQCTWVPGDKTGSPDRADAAVWALTDLMLPKSEAWCL